MRLGRGTSVFGLARTDDLARHLWRYSRSRFGAAQAVLIAGGRGRATVVADGAGSDSYAKQMRGTGTHRVSAHRTGRVRSWLETIGTPSRVRPVL